MSALRIIILTSIIFALFCFVPEISYSKTVSPYGNLPAVPVYTSTSFELYTNIDRRSAEGYLRFFDAFKRYFSRNYFNLSGSVKIRIYLFSDQNTYMRYRELDSEFGYYLSGERLIVTHTEAGLGTMTHELVHSFAYDVIPVMPAWFEEGLPMFFEKFIGYYDAVGELNLVVGLQNPWRVRKFVSGIEKGIIKKPTLLAVAQHTSDSSTERLLSVYLYKKGWLERYIQLVISSRTTDDNAELIVKASGKSLADLEYDWSRWLDTVIADARSPNSSLNTIPGSFVLKNKEEWNAWTSTHRIVLP